MGRQRKKTKDTAGTLDSLIAKIRSLEAMMGGTQGFQRSEAHFEALAKAMAGLNEERSRAAIARLDRIGPQLSVRLQRYLQSFIGIGLGSEPHLVQLLDQAAGLPLEIRAAIAYQVHAYLFSRGRPAGPDLERTRHLFHRKFVSDLRSAVGPVPKHSESERDPKSVVFITQQLLGTGHAPTRDILSYVRFFQSRLGLDCRLVCADQFPARITTPLFRPLIANPSPFPLGPSEITTDDETIALYRVQGPFPDVKGTRAAVQYIADAKPALIIAHGAPNPLADLCTAFSTVVTRNTTSEIGPFESAASLLVRDPTPAEDDLLRSIGSDSEKVIRTDPAFDLTLPDAPAPKSAAGFEDTDFAVCVVGNRLDREAGPEFLDMLEGAAAAVNTLRIGFIGRIDNPAALVGARPNLGRASRFLGYQPDLLNLTGAFDVFVNPPRQGGGTSAAYALANGVPVLTLSGTSDIARICGPVFQCEDLEAMADRLEHLSRGGDALLSLQDQARQRFTEISDVAVMWMNPLREISRRTGAVLSLPDDPLPSRQIAA